MKKALKIIKPVTTLAILVYMYISLFGWQIYWHPSTEEKAAATNWILIPGSGSAIKRYGLRSSSRPDLYVESYRYDNLEELCLSVPLSYDNTCEMISSHDPQKKLDLSGRSASVYLLNRLNKDEYMQDLSNAMDEVLEGKTYITLSYDHGPGRESLIPDNMSNRTWEYYICMYKDGSCRFVVQVI